MNRITKKTGTGLARRTAFWSRLSRGAFTMLAIAGLILATANANASCGNLTGVGSRSPIKMPMLAQAGADNFPGYSDSIVGLWHVVYSANGGTFNETFDQWHSDGTEFENAYLLPAQGNICFGVWKTVAPRTVKLHHIGWTFAVPGDGQLSGTFTLDEMNTVSRDGKTYTGNFTFKTFDLNGVQGADITGTIAATRITVD